jgi:KipI family sensor histidine kinase inhibitor
VEVGDSIHPLVNRKVRDLFMTLQRHPIKGVLEMVPAYRSLMIVFDPLTVSLGAIKEQIQAMHASADPSDLPQPRTIEVPVLYGGEEGPDLEWVARYHGVTPEEVIRLHTGTVYQVYMIGFSPGFPYMGELPEGLDTPRHATPRVKVPQGSVAIAQKQTGIYPVSSPGGWQILGRTPLRLFDPRRWPPTPLQMGDRVRFIALQRRIHGNREGT